ncbi:MAG: YbaB/EbfC family nucleoid-associated protein [Clostridia bacterium]|nr:YbaB/EbfC family nucleoid-associated protein [Clostridia bacterium]MBR3976086.1 YbaB/EbfC family nucleoid-associated protein [Clostridia bacterium]
MKARIPNQGGGSRNDMMLKIQKMQEEMARVQQEVEEAEYSASSGGGAVEVTVSGKHEVLSVKIQPDVVDPEDVEMLEDLLIASLNEAIRKANDTMEREMGKVTGGLNIPGLGI